MRCKYLFVFVFIVFLTYSCEVESIVNEGKDYPESKQEFELLVSYASPTDIKYAQGMDIFDGHVFQSYSDGTIDIIDLESCSFVQTIGPLYDEDGTTVLHMNDLSIVSKENISWLIIPSNVVNGPCFIYSINNISDGEYSINQEFLIHPPELDIALYRGVTQYFSNNLELLQVSYQREGNDGYGDIHMEYYTIDSLKSLPFYTKQWEMNYEKLWAMQGATIEGDYAYLAVGVPHGVAKIYRIDINSGSITCFKNFRAEEDTLKNEEMQGVAYYGGYLFFSTTYGLYKLLK